jgi:hypothetical protein
MASLAAYVIVYTEMRRVEVDVRASDGTWRTETYDIGEAFIDSRTISLDAIYIRSSLA